MNAMKAGRFVRCILIPQPGPNYFLLGAHSHEGAGRTPIGNACAIKASPANPFMVLTLPGFSQISFCERAF
jgi:hypothetical protein